MVARRGGPIVGVMAAWDQAAYKQDIVDALRAGTPPPAPALRSGRPR